MPRFALSALTASSLLCLTGCLPATGSPGMVRPTPYGAGPSSMALSTGAPNSAERIAYCQQMAQGRGGDSDIGSSVMNNAMSMFGGGLGGLGKGAAGQVAAVAGQTGLSLAQSGMQQQSTAEAINACVTAAS